MQIPGIQFHLAGDGYVIAAINLRPTGDAWRQRMRARLGAQGDLIVLIKQRRPRPDDRHLAPDDVDQLRQLIQTALAQEITDRRQERLRVRHQMRRQLRGIRSHGAELQHVEMRVVRADPVRDVINRPLRRQLYRQGTKQKQRRKKHQSNQRDTQIKNPLHKNHIALSVRSNRLPVLKPLRHLSEFLLHSKERMPTEGFANIGRINLK